jgi:hypothetical protein
MSAEALPLTPLDEPEGSNTLRVLGWFSMGMAVAALGIYVGREICSRYKFSHRTPYDFYANAEQGGEFGVGI